MTFGFALTGAEPWPVVAQRVARLEAVPEVTNLWVFDERFNRDVWATLGLLAGVTQRLVLGTCVTDALIRHPALTGAAIATLAEATRGRVVLGLGAGVSGFKALGIERRAPASDLREAVDFLRRFWESEEPFDFVGRSIIFRAGRLHFRPELPIPIVIAGRGPRILQLAGETADIVLVATFTGGPLLDHSLSCVAAGEARRSASRPPLRRGAWVYVSVDERAEAARDAVREGIAVALWGSRPILDELGIAIPSQLRDLMDTVPYAGTPEVIGRAARLIPDELIDVCSIAGTPADCISGLERLRERGFEHLALWPFPPRDRTIDTVVDRLIVDVIPHVRTTFAIERRRGYA